MSNYNIPNDGLPLTFMFDGKIFSKEVDGYYHQYLATTPRTRENSLGYITLDTARNIFNTSKFIGSIIVLADDVNLKV